VRRNELLGLRRCDIDLHRYTVSIERQLEEVPGLTELKYRRTRNGETGIVELSPPVMMVVEKHLERFVDPAVERHCSQPRTGSPFVRVPFGRARRQTGLMRCHFHDLGHYAGTMLASSGASVSEIQKRGRWNSTAMPLRYQHATKERDSYLAHATAAFVPLPEVSSEEIAPTARPNPLPTRAFTLDDALTSENDDESGSGGETRTLNLAGPLERDEYQHPLE
jgi:integrase